MLKIKYIVYIACDLYTSVNWCEAKTIWDKLYLTGYYNCLKLVNFDKMNLSVYIYKEKFSLAITDRGFPLLQVPLDSKAYILSVINSERFTALLSTKIFWGFFYIHREVRHRTNQSKTISLQVAIEILYHVYRRVNA